MSKTKDTPLLLSEHFSLDEMQRSYIASRHNIENVAYPAAVESLQRLCSEVLEPIRKEFGSPIFVSSGFRCPRLNKMVNGAPRSYHLSGRAADISATDIIRLKDVVNRMYLDGVIAPVEYIEYPTFIHLAL